MKKLFLSTLVIIGLTVVSYAQNGTASATMQSSLSFSETTALNFGLLTIPTAASTVTIGATDNRLFGSGDIALIASATIVPKTGIFTITGQADANVSITVPATIALTQGLSIGTSWNTGLVNLGPTGIAQLKIYGELSIPATGVTSGAKTGTYTVTVNY